MILCERFPGLNPLQIDEYRAIEVFELVKNLNTYIDNQKKNKKKRGSNGNGKKKYMVKVTE